MPYYFRSMLALAIANNVIITTWSSLYPTWAVGVCECGVGDKAVVREEHSQSSILIQKGKTICGNGESKQIQKVNILFTFGEDLCKSTTRVIVKITTLQLYIPQNWLTN